MAATVVTASTGLSACTGGSGASKTDFGQQAVDLARHVPACSRVKAEPQLADRTATVATCVIDGHSVQFLAFASAQAADEPLTIRVPEADAYGDGWMASLPGEASLGVQRRIVAQVARALGGKVSIFR